MPLANFKSIALIENQRTITAARNRLRRYGEKVAGNVIELPCSGGCGKTVRVRLKNLGLANIMVCNDRDTRDQCHHNIPSAVCGLTAVKHPQAAGHFMGITYENKGPKAALKGAIKDVVKAIAFPIQVGMGMKIGR
ncbi:hypothetical protein [Aeromonas phage Asp37]|nr:hypothetical protein [Aeromonas phage Asp37]